MNEIHQRSAFMEYLLSLKPEQNKGVLARLRRGLGQPPSLDIGMYPLIDWYIRDDQKETWRGKVHYLVAAMYASHPSHTDEKLNFGQHLAKAAAQLSDLVPTEKRFLALLNTDEDDLYRRLPDFVGLLKRKEIPVNWEELFKDLCYWSSPTREVQRHWANGFWYYRPAEIKEASKQSKNH